MSVGYANLDSHVKGLINGNYPDQGQVHYMVDSNFRTAAQGWSKADRTGPLDLYEARKAGSGGAQYVFRTGDYGTDTLAMQAGVDALVDFRGDILFLTPGSYNPLTAVLLNASSMRLLGPPVRKVRNSRSTITSTGGLTNTLDIPSGIDDVEIGFVQLIPVTTGNSIRAVAADNLFIHNVFWNTTLPAVSTGTQGIVFETTSSLYPEILDCEWLTIVGMGEAMEIGLTDNLYVARNRFISDASTWANVVLTAATTLHAHFHECYFGGRGAFTNVFTGVAGADQLVVTDSYLDGTAAAFSAFETGFDATTAIDIAEVYITGDATGQGGVLGTLT